jgi:hypothetical protein
MTMGISWLQLALVFIAIDVLLLSVWIVRRSPRDDLARPLKILHCSFWGCVLCSAFPIGADWLLATDAGPFVSSVVSNLFLAAFYVFACFYWSALAVLAQRTGRSWILWVVAGLATLAIGFFVSYVLMARHVRRARDAVVASSGDVIGAAARDTPSRS